MSEGFIRTHSGAVNLRYVRRIREVERKGNYPLHYAILDNGEEAQVSLGSGALDELCTRVVPAAPGQAACFLSLDSEKIAPTVNDVWEERVQIVGWAISTNYGSSGAISPQPIFAESPCSNHYVFIEAPDGSWIEQSAATYRTLDEVKEEVLQRHMQGRAEQQPREA